MGKLQPHSLPDQLSRMKAGDILLIPDNGAEGTNQQRNIDTTLRRVEGTAKGTWQVKLCYGLLASDMTQAPFKFYRVERLA